MIIIKSDNSMVSNPTHDVVLVCFLGRMKLSIQDIKSLSKIHVVRCVVSDYKPVYRLVVKPPLDPPTWRDKQSNLSVTSAAKPRYLFNLKTFINPVFKL